jgi:hypothetical protein
MESRPVCVLPPIASCLLALLLTVPAALAHAACVGCLCPGNPCKLCSLPPVEDASPPVDTAGACMVILEEVPPVSKDTAPDTYYERLNNAMRECVRSGGDVIRNSARTTEFPSKFYCKPYIASGNQPASEN